LRQPMRICPTCERKRRWGRWQRASTHRLEMRSERIELRRSIRFDVRRYFWYIGSSSDQGGVRVKKSFSLARASSQVMPCFRSSELGCFTQYQLFSSVSCSLRIRGSQLSSSPRGILAVRSQIQCTGKGEMGHLSGLVSTPEMGQHIVRWARRNTHRPCVFPPGRASW
jgi:hypothetical protein